MTAANLSKWYVADMFLPDKVSTLFCWTAVFSSTVVLNTVVQEVLQNKMKPELLNHIHKYTNK